MNQVIVTSPVALSKNQLDSLHAALKLDANDPIEVIIDPQVIAGLNVSVNGQTIDLTVRHQLTEIAREN